MGRPNLIFCNLLFLCGDVELNPGPNQNTTKKLAICHWNLNSIAVDNFAKLVLLKAHNLIHKFDIIDIHLRIDKACVIFLKLFTNFFLLAN